MEKINIAELLKDCPKGMELYSPIFGNVYLEKIRPYLAVVVSTSDKQKKEFLYDGRFGINGECMLFPSKENRDWSEFHKPFKDGDVVTYKLRGNLVAFIYKNRINKLLVKSHFALYLKNIGFSIDGDIALKEEEIVFATEEEKEKLFNAIKENGYRWNAEKKELERLIVPKFKVGDRIKSIISQLVYTIKEVRENAYLVEEKTGCFFVPFFVERNYELVPNKFDITTLMSFKSEVLVRHTDIGLWRPAIFGFISDNGFGVVGGNAYEQCIPYKGNEHLMGKFDDCDEYYKTWK